MTCTGPRLTLTPEKYYYFHYFSQKREVQLLLCVEINLLSVHVFMAMKQELCLCQIPHTAGNSSCQPRSVAPLLEEDNCIE